MRREEEIDGHEAMGKIGSRAHLGKHEEGRAARDGLKQLGSTAASMNCDRCGNPLQDS